eukprot:274423_1
MISLFYLWDQDCYNNKLGWCLDDLDASQRFYITDNELKASMEPLWNEMQTECDNIIKKQNLMLNVVLNMSLDTIVIYVKRIRQYMDIIYEYLYCNCDWKTKYYTPHLYLKHIPNNLDCVESTHGSGSRISKTNDGISKAKLRVKLLFQKNSIMDFLLALYFDESKHELLFYIFDHVLNINVAQYSRNMKQDDQEYMKQKAKYYNKHMKRKTIAQRMNQTRRTLNRHASALSDVTLDSNKRGRKRQITDMFNVETEIDEHEYEAMENEINAQTDNDVIMWNGDENTNTHPRTQPLRRSSRKKKKVTYPE